MGGEQAVTDPGVTYVSNETQAVYELLKSTETNLRWIVDEPFPDVDNKIRWLVKWMAAQAADLCRTGQTVIANQAINDGQQLRKLQDKPA